MKASVFVDGVQAGLAGPGAAMDLLEMPLPPPLPAADVPHVSQTHWKPRPELDTDLNPAYPSPGNSGSGGRPVG